VCASATDIPSNVLRSDSSVNREQTATNTIKKSPITKYFVHVSAAVVDRGPCRDLITLK